MVCECGVKARFSGYCFSEVPSCISQFVDPQFLSCMACAGKKCIEFRKDNIGLVLFVRRNHLEIALGEDFSIYFEAFDGDGYNESELGN